MDNETCISESICQHVTLWLDVTTSPRISMEINLKLNTVRSRQRQQSMIYCFATDLNYINLVTCIRVTDIILGVNCNCNRRIVYSLIFENNTVGSTKPSVGRGSVNNSARY